MLYSLPIPYASKADDYYAAIADLPWAMWLDSGGLGRFDILVAAPVATLVTSERVTEVNDAMGRHLMTDAPLELLRQQIGPPLPAIPGIPFCGGALGYWSYDFARQWMELGELTHDLDELPDMAVGIYDWAIIIDHQELEARLVSRLRAPKTEQVLQDILVRLQKTTRLKKDQFRIVSPIRTNISRSEYVAAFEHVHQYLFAGDCYQVNLSQRFSAEAKGDGLEAFLAMREITPAPYGAFLNYPFARILSVSPERFIAVRDGKVETKPIKGTRPRGEDAAADAQLIADLHSNEKDRAENLMIVDLLRNDISKSCIPGSVKVEKLFEVESYANVHHLVSTITGKLLHNKDALALLKDCLPGGSITGAPKRRAMQIIDQLEPLRRGLYCGSIGYVGWDGNMDSNIAIRTLIYANGEIHFSVGGGIVADSNADGEYQETLDKASGMLKMLQAFRAK